MPQRQHLLDDNAEVGDRTFLVECVHLVHRQGEALPQRAKLTPDKVRITCHPQVFAEEQLEEIVHALDVAAALSTQLIHEFGEFAYYDNPDRLEIFRRIPPWIDGNQTAEKWQYLVQLGALTRAIWACQVHHPPSSPASTVTVRRPNLRFGSQAGKPDQIQGQFPDAGERVMQA